MAVKLKHELDFNLEARNNERCADQLKEFENITVPKIRWDLTGNRILTMEFIDGQKLCPENLNGENLKEIGKFLKFLKNFNIYIFINVCMYVMQNIYNVDPIDIKI